MGRLNLTQERLEALTSYFSRVVFEGTVTLKYKDYSLGFIGSSSAKFNNVYITASEGFDIDSGAYPGIIVILEHPSIRDDYLHHPISHIENEKIEISMRLLDKKIGRYTLLSGGFISNFSVNSIDVLFDIEQSQYFDVSSIKPYNRFEDLED